MEISKVQGLLKQTREAAVASKAVCVRLGIRDHELITGVRQQDFSNI